MPTSLRTAAVLLGLCGLLTACGESLEPGSPPPAERTRSTGKLLRAGAQGIPGRYIVVFEDAGAQRLGAPLEVRQASDALTRAHGGTPRRVYASALKAFSASLTEEEARRMSEDPRVRYVQQERVFSIQGVQFYPTWGLDRVDQRDWQLDDRYNYEYTGAGVHVYVLDTGIRGTHAEFAGRMGAGFDSVGDGLGTTDCHGHGTHVAGTAGGTTYGVAKGVTLHPVRVLDCTGNGSTEQVLAGIDWVTAQRVNPAVVNMSLTGPVDLAVDEAIRQSIASGVTYVVGAGNDGWEACNNSPARLPEAITVGSTSAVDTMSFFSNFGTCLDLFAPGEEILSAWASGDSDTYTTSGTSMATPHATGAAALYLEGHPSATPAEVAAELSHRGTHNVVEGAGEGSPNVLLHTACMGAAGQVPPQVTLTAPAQGATLSGTVTLSATASDDVGVSRVDFYLDGVLLGSDSTAPYSVTWDSNEALNGSGTLSARAFDASCNSQASSVSVTVQNAGKAAYEPLLGAPSCAALSHQCDSVNLLAGRGLLLGPEQNTPNTLGNSCADGAEGWYQLDPSLEQLKVFHEGGSLLASGKQVRISVTVFAGFDSSVERLELYSAADARAPVWTHIRTLMPMDFGPQVLSTTFILPHGSDLQAIRGVYRYGGSTSPCPGGMLDDVDDLVFAVSQEPDTQPPTATLTAPAAGATLAGTATLTATATDDFSVTHVEFYDGATLLATDATAPYSVTWDTRTAANGAHSLSVRAYDAAGLVGTSASVGVTVSNDATPPTVAFTAPAAGATVSNTVTITGTASDNVSVARVDLYLGTTLLGSDTAAPYSFSWNTRTSSNGAYTLTLKAYDAAGNVGTAERSVTTDNDFTAPTVAVTAPAEGATVSGTITLTASASDDRGTVSRVAYFVGTTLVGNAYSAPYSFSYNTRNLTNGAKVITAKAYDPIGNEGTSAPVNVTFNNDITPPTVAVTAPAEGATLSGTVTFTASASDDRGTVSRVAYFVGTTLVGNAYSAPYSFSYNTRNLTNGAKVITAKAYDPIGNEGTSAPVNVTFNNDFTAPTVAVTAPAQGATLSGTVTLTASASDDRGTVSRVSYFIGTTLVGSAYSAPYSFSYNTRGMTNGAKVITAKAYDAVNNEGTSAPVNVTFNNDFTAPTAAVTSPAGGATLSGTVTFTASASDNVAVTQVAFFVDSTLLGYAYSAPYSFSYNTRGMTNGPKVITARAYDAAGNLGTSAGVSVTFNNDFTAPTATLTSPTSGATVSGVVQLTCNASDNWGVVSKVEFYEGSTLLGSTTTAPYGWSWDTTKSPTGSQWVKCRAFDPTGNSAYSPNVQVTVVR